MNKTTITLSSVTYAIKMQKLLNREGIKSELVKVSDEKNKGCTHGIKIDQNNLFSAVNLLRQRGIEYGVMEEP